MAQVAAPRTGSSSGGGAAAAAARRWPPAGPALPRPAGPHAPPPPAEGTHTAVQACGAGSPASRSRLLRGLAAGALLCVNATRGPPSAAAVAAAEPAETAAAAARGGVVAVAAIASGKGAAAGVQQIGSGVVWGEGHVVVPYAPLTRVDRQGTAGTAQVLVTVQAADGRSIELPAAVVAKDPSHELAVLQVELQAGQAGLLRPLPLASSAALRTGQDALLLAALPGGEPSVAAGVVSATGRVIPASNNQAIPGVLQTDAEVNAQSLGGALVDSGGRLVGMPVVSYTKPGVFRSSGVNFAIPSDLLREVVPQLIVYRSAQARR